MEWRLDEAIAWMNNPGEYVIKNGTELVAFLLNQILQSIALNAKTAENSFFEDGQYSIFQFIWTSRGLKVNQMKESGNNGKVAHVCFAVNAELAKAMGWFIENRDGSFRLGRNLEILKKHMGVLAKFIALSLFFTWQFINLDEAFHRFIGCPSQSLVVFSDVAGSRVVGSDIVNVLKEVEYEEKTVGASTLNHNIFSMYRSETTSLKPLKRH